MNLIKQFTSPECTSAVPPKTDACSSSVANNEIQRRRLNKRSIETRSSAKNMQLICITPEEHAQSPPTIPLSLKKIPRMVNFYLDEQSLEDLLKYREKYQSICRRNPMYTSKSQNKPWDVVAWYVSSSVLFLQRTNLHSCQCCKFSFILINSNV